MLSEIESGDSKLTKEDEVHPVRVFSKSRPYNPEQRLEIEEEVSPLLQL